jgi:curved DNA-binding protein CbpA
MAFAGSTNDYYATLEVVPSTLHDEIKASYRRLALLHHPDKKEAEGRDAATAKMKLLNEAWGVLQDAVKRGEYDRNRPKFNASSSNARPGTPKASPEPRPQATPWPGHESASPSPSPGRTHQAEARAEQERKRQGEVQAEQESTRKEQEYFHFTTSQEAKIKHSRCVITSLSAELAFYQSEIHGLKTKLSNDTPPTWKLFSFGKKKMSEDEIRKTVYEVESRIRGTQIALDTQRTRLQMLNWKLGKRGEWEEKRVCDEWDRERGVQERRAREASEGVRGGL